ncbi:MAG: metallophosphoesterase [Bacteroidota bacterium]
MNIIFITDLHIGRAGEDTYGVDVRKNFLHVLSGIRKEQMDHLIIGGDLCYRDGDAVIYEWIKQQLDQLGVPYSIIAGNHDDPKLLASIFQMQSDLKGGELYYCKRFLNWNALFLDTSSQKISSIQLNWLEQQLATFASPALIFMHHPPINASVSFMDENYPLLHQEEMQSLLKKNRQQFVIPIFTGHYHTEKTVVKDNLLLQITPSTYFQIDQRSSDFKVDHYQIAYRRIELGTDGWKSCVVYLEGAKL